MEEWLTADEIGRLSETNALVMARRRWVDARDEYTRSVDADARHLRARAAQLCGPVSRPVWAKDTGQPWHAR